MSWYKKSLRETTLVEHQQQFAEDNRDDIDYLVRILAERKELTQALRLVEDMIDDDHPMTVERSEVLGELVKLNDIWNNYDQTLREFALYLSRNEEL